MSDLFTSSTGSPLQFYVDAINSGHVTAYGPGLSHGMVNKPAVFTIVTKDAGEGIFLPEKFFKAGMGNLSHEELVWMLVFGMTS